MGITTEPELPDLEVRAAQIVAGSTSVYRIERRLDVLAAVFIGFFLHVSAPAKGTHIRKQHEGNPNSFGLVHARAAAGNR